MELFKGNLVRESASGLTGVITDRDTGTGHALVRFDQGEDRTSMDATHGRWLPLGSLVKVGHDADALVWRITRMGPAGPDRGADPATGLRQAVAAGLVRNNLRALSVAIAQSDTDQG